MNNIDIIDTNINNFIKNPLLFFLDYTKTTDNITTISCNDIYQKKKL